MKKFYMLMGALVCVLGLTAFSEAQLTTITASSIKMGGTPIAAGSITLTPVDSNGKPIPFVQAGGGLNSGHPFTCKVQNGAITGICQVPDSAITTPAHISYSIQISSTPSQKAFVLSAVPNITGSTWALDDYAPAANTTNVEPIQVSYGVDAPPSSCVAPSFYVRNASGGLLYMCVGSSWVLVTGSGGGSASVTPEAMSSAVATLTGCSDSTKSWSPAANACVSNTGPQGPAGATGATGAQGPAGASGTAASVSVGTVTTGTAGSSASVTNSGTSSAAVLNFTIPRGLDGSQGPAGQQGEQGPAGTAATIAVGTVSTGAPGSSASVTNTGSSSAAVLAFTIPQGPQGLKGEQGPQGPSGGSTNWRGTWNNSTSYVTYDAIAYQGSSYIAVVDNSNVIPGSDGTTWQLLAQVGAQGPAGEVGPTGNQGTPGSAATVSVGTVTTGSAGSSVTVTNSGTSSAAVLDFAIPRGDPGNVGPRGADGAAATLTVGTVTSLAPGSTPTVTNAGTSNAAILNFGLPTTGTRFWSCQPGIGDGSNTIATGTYTQWTCRNDTGSTVTLTGISCIADAGSSTVSMTNGADAALLSVAITCGASYTAGTQSATTTLADGDFIKLTIAASDSKQVSIDVKGTL